ncbi:hypothetical protein K7711_44380 [Nocardia sp. CA2R105]|uniref:hypothetical protein n=1 Tax=Nocardia coffeae TaxID=2873381 RepID=UPI001CA77367|nr:hypothetical protein [Nocardia coffeae]MBY8863569.1 hypothetical protein [Nocardia coffeae]
MADTAAPNAAGTPAPASAPVDPGAEYLNAIDSVTGAFALDSTSGRLIGTAAGVIVGCPLGAVTGGSLTIAVPVLTPVGIVGGCIVGGSAGGFIGGTIGSLVTGTGPTANAMNQQYNSLHSKGLIAQQVQASNSGR